MYTINTMLTRHASCLLLAGLLAATSCNDKEDDPQPFAANFTNTELGISPKDTEAEVQITFSRAAGNAGTLTVQLSSADLTYGENADFYTDPEAENGIVTLSYEAGAETTAFSVFPGSGLNIQETATLSFTLQESGTGDYITENNSELTVSFSENFVAPSGTIELNGGGPATPNQAFVDLSKLTQTTVDKYSWDLGFYSGSEYRVVLNNSAYVMARPLDKADLNGVTAEDTTGFSAVMSVPNYDPSAGASAWIDDQSGDLSGTAFGEISATASENKVFIIKRDGEGRSWKKVRVLQNGDGYTIQYADIDATTYATVDISKDEAYNFTFFDLDDEIVTVEPEKDSWDIMYSTYALRYSFGGSAIPYGFNDYIITNRAGVEVAMVMIAKDLTYENFSSANIDALTFGSEIDALGANWRQGGGPTTDPSLYNDRFFVLKDTDGQYYKIKFTRLTSTTGERGYPEFTFNLVQP